MTEKSQLKLLLKHLFLQEATRFKRETGESLPRPYQKLLKYEEAGGYFIHFSSVPRMGLFVRNKYNTPIGFYCYLLNRNKISEFGTDRPYLLVIKPKPEARILDLQTYTDADLGQDIQKLLKLVPSNHTEGNIEWAMQNAKNKRPGGKLWAITRFLSGAHRADHYLEKVPKDKDLLPVKGGGPTGTWTMLFKRLGYDGVLDPGFGIIHEYEPSQAVFFDTAKLELVEVVQKKEEDGVPGASVLFEPKKAILSNKDFSGKNLSGKSFVGAVMHGTKFVGADLSGTNFTDATFRMADLTNANLTNANLFGYTLKIWSTELVGANLTGADLAMANIRDSRFDGANLQRADLSGSVIRNASFRRVNLQGTNLQGAHLNEVDFYKATYDSKTKFPEGFDPVKENMVLVGETE